MKKRLISLFLSLVLILSLFSFGVSAEELPDSSHTHTWVDSMYPSFDGEVGGFHVTVELKECSDCAAFLHNVNINGMVFRFVNARACLSLSGELQDFILSKIFLIYGQNATATKFEAGGGQPGTGGAGRYPSGYTSDGVPSVSTSGKPTLAIPHSEIELDFYSGSSYPSSYCSDSGRSLNTNIAKHVCVISGNKLVSTSYPKSTYNFSAGYARYSFTAPVDGYYRLVPITFSLSTTF